MGFSEAEERYRRARRAEVEGTRLMLRAVRRLLIVLAVLWVLVAGFGLLLEVTGRAPSQQCSSSCERGHR
jgi:cell division septal protein FtsQ